MIEGIAIYSFGSEIPRQFKKIEASPKESPFLLYFLSVFTNLESQSLPKLPDKLSSDKFNYFHSSNGQHHYIFNVTLGEKNLLFTLISKKILDVRELCYLLINIKHAYNKVPKLSLDEIRTNYLNYIGKDVMMNKIQNNLDETVNQLYKNMEKLLTRHEKIEELEQNTEKLKGLALQFNVSAQKYNRNCCF